MKLIVKDLAIEYTDDGLGPVLLMLHGWKDSLHSFDPLLSELTKHFRVIRLDMPGFGGSETPSAAWDLNDYVNFVASFCEKLEISPRYIAGHSFGGRVSIKGIAQGTLAPEKLILIASAGVARRNTLRIRSLKALATVGKVATLPLPRSIKSRMRARLYKNIKSDYANAGALAETFKRVINEDLSRQAGTIRIPALLIWGSADTETTLEEGVRLSELIKGSTLEILQAAGHFVHREKSEEVARLVIKFLC